MVTAETIAEMEAELAAIPRKIVELQIQNRKVSAFESEDEAFHRRARAAEIERLRARQAALVGEIPQARFVLDRALERERPVAEAAIYDPKTMPKEIVTRRPMSLAAGQGYLGFRAHQVISQSDHIALIIREFKEGADYSVLQGSAT
jgi:hypothetical protein